MSNRIAQPTLPPNEVYPVDICAPRFSFASFLQANTESASGLLLARQLSVAEAVYSVTVGTIYSRFGKVEEFQCHAESVKKEFLVKCNYVKHVGA